MTYATEKSLLGRIPVTVVELDLDTCSLTYGTGACTAAGAAGSECYNTRKTCQDAANYTKATKTYRFCQPVQGLPVTVDMIPAVTGKPSFVPGKITPGKGLGYRASVSIRVKDFPYHDRGIDPYVATRSYAPESQGTFWGKLLNRTPYYYGRVMRIRTGYVGSSWDWANFKDHAFIIEDIKGPDKSGYVTITGKDVLKLADDKKSQCPAASTGKLLADITAGASSFTLTPAGIGNSEYAASGTLRVGGEEMTFTRSGDAVTITARPVNGTENKAHEAGDIVQQCKVYTSTNIVDVIDDLLNNYVDGFDAASWIPYDQGISGPLTGTNDQWDDEKADWLTANVTRTISKPTGVNQLIAELTIEFMFNIFWHQTDQELKLKAIAPPKANVSVQALNENSHILEDSISVQTDEKQRLSQVWVYYNKVNNAEDAKPENYKNLYIDTDLVQEDDNLYGAKQIKIIHAVWISSEAEAATVAGRFLARFYENPKIIRFALDAKDEGKMPSELVAITTKYIQDETGASEQTRFEITEVRETEQGHRFEYEALISRFNGLYGFIGPDTLLDYSAESSANKQAYAFICPDSGIFADGSKGYKII